jgi:hypothetical protein
MGNVTWAQFILLAIVLFIIYWLWVEIGGRHGQAPVFPDTQPAVRRNE